MTLELCRTAAEFRAACEKVRGSGGTLGLVPTMGALHVGHTALIEAARKLTSSVAVTIFVNPTQFGPNEDFERYPRDLERDLEKCRSAGASIVFSPSVQQMYAEGERTRVRVSELGDALCGASRPGHFEGVATIVCKLFAIAGPCSAVFGRKDYQQLKIILRMTRDLMLPIRIVDHPTVREPDGLALSSRNAYLSPDERQRALAIPRALSHAVEGFAAGERRVGTLREPVARALEQAGLGVDYVTLAEPEQLTPFSDSAVLEARGLLALAAFAGPTRLIDNVVLGEDPAPLASRGAMASES